MKRSVGWTSNEKRGIGHKTFTSVFQVVSKSPSEKTVILTVLNRHLLSNGQLHFSTMKTLHWYISGLFIALLYIYLLAVQYVRGASSNIDFNYHNHDEMTSILNNLNQQYPDLTALYSVGKSVEGMQSVFSFLPFH